MQIIIVILNSPTTVAEGFSLRELILGDGLYPLSNWLLKPYPQIAKLSESKKKINKHFSSVCVVAERPFGVKARWHCLLK